MTDTTTETVRLTDGRALRMTIATPEHAVRGGLVVLHEGTASAVAAIFAHEGWLTVVPEPVDGAYEYLFEDFDAAGVWLSERDIPSDRVGVLGFDLGGGAALAIAAKRSIGAAASIAAPLGGAAGPKLPAAEELAAELACPWLGVFDAGEPGVPALSRAVASSEVAHDVLRFPDSGHRFDQDPEAGDAALHRVLNWFDAHLR